MSTVKHFLQHNPDLIGLLAFVRVAELGSFVAASQTLGLSKAAISKRLAALEAHLGARLLHRTTRRLSLTEAGLIYLEHAQKVCREALVAEDAVSEIHSRPRGTIRASVPLSFGLLHIAPWLASFLECYPQITVDLHFDDMIHDLIMEGLDVAIRIGDLRDSSLIARCIATSRVVLCAAPAYLEKRGRPQRPEDLHEHDCLLYSLVAWGQTWELRRGEEKFRMALVSRLQANSSLALKDATLHGAGVLRIPEFAVKQELQRGQLERVLPDWEMNDLKIHAVMPERRYIPKKIRVFVDFLQQCWLREEEALG
ncbi:Transcriptional regulator, LysR family [Pseudomonas chlororaphis]|uniref:Transcriptional regulator, LysR family n=1 Tax=Pseudomonas chlororaphis TaxID=587753 RepID=A0A3G7TSQ3_9PSED|nr:LysR family transcriptional regulator [Pseudomonas chlororaphis]AZE49472.1 Transcriptional regulator, LysR family [Pseudomonas chlororaphis]